MSKFYFRRDDENCYDLEYHLNYMKKNGIKKMEVFEAKRETVTGYFFCKENLEVFEVGLSCGIECENYKPNNGKNGRCKHYRYVYEQTEKTRILQNN